MRLPPRSSSLSPPTTLAYPPHTRPLALPHTEMNEATTVLIITVGSYQGLCNLYRVFNFDPATLPAKVGGCMVSVCV